MAKVIERFRGNSNDCDLDKLIQSIDRLALALFTRTDAEEIKRLVIENGKKLDQLLALAGTGPELDALVSTAKGVAERATAGAEAVTDLEK